MKSKNFKVPLLFIALIAFCWPIAQRDIVGSDLWWNLSIGKYIDQNHNYPVTGTFSWNATKSPDHLERSYWGDLLLYKTYKYFNIEGFYYIRWIFLLCTWILLLSLFHWRANFWTLVSGIFLTYGAYQKLALRKALFAWGACLLLVGIYFLYIKKSRWWILLSLPLLVLWSKLHGSVLVGWGFLGLILVSEIYLCLFKKNKLHTLLPILLSFGLGSYISWDWGISQYLNLLPFLETSSSNSSVFEPFQGTFQQAGDAKAVYEYASPFDHLQLLCSKLLILLLVLWLFHILYAIAHKKLDLPRQFILLGLFIFASGHLRTLPYAFLIGLPLLIDAQLQLPSLKKLSGFNPTHKALTLFLGFGFLTFFILNQSMPNLIGEASFRSRGQISNYFSSSVPNYTLKHYPNEPTLHTDFTGSWCMWLWGLDKKVYNDGRSALYTQDFLNEVRHNLSREHIENNSIHKAIYSQYHDQTPSIQVRLQEGWTVEAFDTSLVLLSKTPTKQHGVYLGHSKEYSKLSHPQRIELRIFIHNTLKAYLTQGRLSDALNFIENNEEGIALQSSSERIFLRTITNELKRWLPRINHPLFGQVLTPLYQNQGSLKKDRLYATWAIACEEIKHFPHAYALFQEASKLAPEDISLCMKRGQLAWGLGKAEEALDAFIQASRLDPQHFASRYNVIHILYQLGHRQKAQPFIQEALTINPKDKQLLNLIKNP